MQRRTTIIGSAALAVVAVGVGLGIWLAQPSYDDTVRACQRALDPTSTKTNRPDACEDLTEDDYTTVHMHYVLKNALNDMPKKDKDTLDYYDDGTINGSLD
ncbi:hypothetical protein ABZY90_19680 [Streptomyces sp. NPDC006422]|uniref:hypothetical protein n=1 Tax=unclassified Streptomyces TaxID=2593676 RepID=UPI0033BBECA5